jgi:hypothetical protein
MPMTGGAMTRSERRLERQFEAIARAAPALRGPMNALRRDSWIVLRVPLALVLIAGGVFSFLPFLGIWMLPLGLLLLAVDLPFLRGPIAALLIRGRRRIGIWMAWWRSKRRA